MVRLLEHRSRGQVQVSQQLSSGVIWVFHPTCRNGVTSERESRRFEGQGRSLFRANLVPARMPDVHVWASHLCFVVQHSSFRNHATGNPRPRVARGTSARGKKDFLFPETSRWGRYSCKPAVNHSQYGL